MAEKELTERESRRNLTLSTLERTLIQDTLGTNIIKTDPYKYGQVGLESAESSYDSLMSSEEVQKMKEGEYQSKKREYKELGVAGEPAYPVNSEISYKIIQGLEQTMQISHLEDLAEGVKKVAPALKYDLPDKLKGFIYGELIQKAVDEKGNVDIKKLNQDEQAAIGSYEILREAYRRSVAMNIVNSNYLGDLNAQAKQIMDAYNPEGDK